VTGPPGLDDALGALAIDEPTSYVWLGQRFRVRPEEADDDALDALTAALGARLYADFYCAGGVAPPADDVDPHRGWVPVEAERFSAANAGRGARQGGWLVRGRDADGIAVQRGDLVFWAQPAEVLSPNPRPGDVVTVVLPKESIGLLEGFYVAVGDAGDPAALGGAMDRFYFNVRPEGRAGLIAALTTRLNARGLPFRLKVLNDARALRCDAAVLYAPASERSAVAGALSRLLPRLAHLRSATSAFTLRLAPGVAFAEDPPGEESFGQHRCRIVAAALVDAHRRGATAPRERAAAVETRWAAEGLAHGAPHLNPGSDEADDPRLAPP
jgi:hypothetical protein